MAQITNQATPNINVNPEEVDMQTFCNEFKKNIMFSLNCHHIGTIQEFDSTNQTATVTINYQRVLLNQSGGNYVNTLVPYPLITRCPVIILSGSGNTLTFPISQGDTCLLLFNDRDFDNWFNGLENGGVGTSRAHAFTDAIALVGLSNLNGSIQNYDAQRAVISTPQGTKVGVNLNNKATILNTSTTLGTQLNTLITQVNNLLNAVETINTAVGGLLGGTPPVTPTTLTAIGTALSSTSTAIGTLLE